MYKNKNLGTEVRGLHTYTSPAVLERCIHVLCPWPGVNYWAVSRNGISFPPPRLFRIARNAGKRGRSINHGRMAKDSVGRGDGFMIKR